jgi:hypothetical protein
MIPEDRYPLLSSWINFDTALFKNAVMVGIYDGSDICSSFLNTTNVLDSLTFYENFFDGNDLKLKELYKDWQNKIPNLKFKYQDGYNIEECADFVFTDAYNIDYETYFLDEKFLKTLFCICGYGAEIKRTVDLSCAIKNKNIFPVLLYNGFVFFTNNQSHYKTCFESLKSYFDNNNIEYIKREGCLKPKGMFHMLLDKSSNTV